MTYEEYWQGDPWLVVSYREAHDLKREMRNQEMYIQGRYIYDGFSAVMAQFMGALSGKKSKAEQAKYPDYPYAITEREKAEEKKRKIAKTRDWIERSQAAQRKREKK